jgi:hypothetical protein
MMRQHWMAIPIAAITPLLIAALVLAHTEHWSNGAVGVVVLGLMSIACVVGSFMAPIDPETRQLIPKDNRRTRPGRYRSSR